MNTKTQVNKNNTRNGRGPQVPKPSGKPASVESPAGRAELRKREIASMAAMHGALACHREVLKHILQGEKSDVRSKASELIGLLDEFNFACCPEELTDAALAERYAEIQAGVTSRQHAGGDKTAHDELLDILVDFADEIPSVRDRSTALLLIMAEKLDDASMETQAPFSKAMESGLAWMANIAADDLLGLCKKIEGIIHQARNGLPLRAAAAPAERRAA